MKFIKLESRGGNYLVVAENVAWLRTAENGQTNVGIIGSQPLLVVGSIEEVAATIIAATAHYGGSGTDASFAAHSDTTPKTAPAPAEEEAPAAEDSAARAARSEPVNAPRPRPGAKSAPSLRDRLPVATGLRVKAGSQRFMGMTE